MKILIVDTFYPPYLAHLYSSGQLINQTWASQHKSHFTAGFGTGDAYSNGLCLLGIEAIEIVANSMPLQLAWAREHRPDLLDLQDGGQQLLAILEAQIQWFQATVLYVQDINWLPPAFLRKVKSSLEMIVGQNACPLSPSLDLSSYDLLLTSLPHYVGKFRAMGVNSAYFPIGFDQRLLQRHRTDGPRSHALTFVGGLGGHHKRGTHLLEVVAHQLPLQIWGYGHQQLPSGSILKQRWQGEAWAEDMYHLLSTSKITINRHIDIAGDYACNMRLYEATGMGACLVTDHKSNISELFEPDNEIITYQSPSEAVSKISELMNNPNLLKEISVRGQSRTLKDHTYEKRMQLLVEILRRQKGFQSFSQDIRPVGQHAIKLIVPIYLPKRLEKSGKVLANKIRSRTISSNVRVVFFNDKKLSIVGESAWSPLTASENETTVRAFFDCFDNGAFAIIHASRQHQHDSCQDAFVSEARRRGLVLKYIYAEEF